MSVVKKFAKSENNAKNPLFFDIEYDAKFLHFYYSLFTKMYSL